MTLWAFSDLHLDASDLYQEFLSVLDHEVRPGDTVVFAGDIFDLFVGNSRLFQRKFEAFFEALRSLAARKVELHYIFGNHDFNLEQSFEGIAIQLHDEQVELLLAAPGGYKKMFVAHGDLVDPTDTGYLRMRKLFRSFPMRVLSTLLPGTAIQRIGSVISRKSDQKVADLPEGWPAERRNQLRKTFRNYAADKRRQGFDFVILGHCHDLDEQAPFYFNMGYPPVHRQYLRYDSASGLVSRHQFPGIPRKN